MQRLLINIASYLHLSILIYTDESYYPQSVHGVKLKLMNQLTKNSEVEGFLNTFWVSSFELGDLNNFSPLRNNHPFYKKKKKEKKSITLVINSQFRMHSNTHLVELVLVTRVVMVLEEAILALMV